MKRSRVREKTTNAAFIAFMAIWAGLLSPSHADGLKSLAKFPKKLMVFTLGTTVGTPVAMVRCTHREVIKRTKEAYDLGGVPKPIGYLTAGFFGIPSGIFFGAGVGAADGVMDSITNTSDEPLNKASLSLDKLYF